MPNRERDLDDLTIPTTKLDVAAMLGIPSKRARDSFVTLPMAWVKRLQDAKHVATYRLALFLQYRNWKQPNEPIMVSNVALGVWGVSRRRKSEAILELEALELIEIEQHGRQSSVVKLK